MKDIQHQIEPLTKFLHSKLRRDFSAPPQLILLCISKMAPLEMTRREEQVRPLQVARLSRTLINFFTNVL